MDTDAIRGCLGELEEQLDAILTRERFSRSMSPIPASEFEWRRWTRETSWKREVVELAFPRESLMEAVGFAEIHLRINLRYPANDEGLFDGTTVSGLSHEASGHYHFPSSLGIFKARALARYRDRILGAITQSLEWFDRYATPKRCLERLHSGETSVGPIKDSGAARQAFDFLSSIIMNKS